ncbi:13.88 kDa late protein [Salmonella phage SLMP1]|uniref:13.88 kDa late protein n=2 Tax=Viruses TaxID=10239 RepID=A0AAE7P968_9CAUD|nr:13.88 kDa late protein [Salmonella phage SLMP1]QQK87831.1 13.88 kDa late protein [Salmonella phage SLMP1]
MLEQFIKLFERFVVAHELIAANSAKQVVQVATPLEVETVSYTKEAVEEAAVELPVEGENVLEQAKEAAVKIVIEQNKAQSTNKSGEVIEEPKRKPRKAKVEEPAPKPEEEKEEVDYQSLRDQIQAIDDVIGEGPSDAAYDDSNDLLEEFTGKKMKLAAIKDEDLAEYLERLTAIKNKYFEEE